MTNPLTLPEFVARWERVTTSERASAQSHFIDLCDVLGQPRPVAADPEGSFYTFEKGVRKTAGGQGFADVWFQGRFGWEYKGRHRDLAAAYQQLLQYREDLENPPLLVVCDLDRFEVHTNFTGTVKRIYRFTLADLLKTEPIDGTFGLSPLVVLRSLWTEPERLRPEVTSELVTEQAAGEFARLADSLRARGHDPSAAAHFLMRLLFCLFAEDTGLLPDRLFTRLVAATKRQPEQFGTQIASLFGVMARGGYFGVDAVPFFNGGLFADDIALPLLRDDIDVLARAAALDWASVEPAIFGTLFERSLDPSKRSQLGAHYTSKEDILLIVEPVLMEPLRRRWTEVRGQAAAIIARRDEIAARLRSAGAQQAATLRRQRDTQNAALTRLLASFSEEIAATRVLDPACGSGNFLYVALKRLLDLEKEVITFAATNGLPAFFPHVHPRQLAGIEINTYANELASVVVWIGYIQWLRDNGFDYRARPILEPLTTIQQMDAILAHDADGRPVEPQWPDAEVIIGNPPFLGDKKMRGDLGDEYVDELRRLYEPRIVGGADLVTFWFERARERIATGGAKRAGLIATNSIRLRANRRVLERINQSGGIFMAWSDRPWVLDGADVRVSIVGLDDGSDRNRVLNGAVVGRINADLTSIVPLTTARALEENQDLCFLGMMKGGPFDVDSEVARTLLAQPLNPNGRPNSDVVKRRLGGQEVTGRLQDIWIIDFVEMSEAESALYEAPFEYVRRVVKPVRDTVRDARMRSKWWLHGRSRPALRHALAGKRRCIVTPEVAKHRVFIWMDTETIPDHTLHVITRDDDYFFGLLHSRPHELWSLGTGARIGVGNDPRYTSTLTFATFPFPWPPGHELVADPRVEAIAEATHEMVRLRDNWLNPEGATEEELRRRTLTNLYNQRPTWLDLAHRRLDAAVLDAYGWPHDLTDEQSLERLLALNLERSAGQ